MDEANDLHPVFPLETYSGCSDPLQKIFSLEPPPKIWQPTSYSYLGVNAVTIPKKTYSNFFLGAKGYQHDIFYVIAIFGEFSNH
jgi:hypothetical protein